MNPGGKDIKTCLEEKCLLNSELDEFQTFLAATGFEDLVNFLVQESQVIFYQKLLSSIPSLSSHTEYHLMLCRKFHDRQY